MNDMPRPGSVDLMIPTPGVVPFPDSVETLRRWLRMHQGSVTVTELENTWLPAEHPMLNVPRPVTAVREDGFQVDGCGWEAFSGDRRYRFDRDSRTVTLHFGDEIDEGRMVMRLESRPGDGPPRTSVH